MIMVRSVTVSQAGEEGYHVTGRLKIIRVHDVDYYLSKAGRGMAHYYLTPASEGYEPPGVWVGTGAADLGLRGLVEPEVMKRLYERGIGPGGKQVGHKRPV
jgi:TrwC relaxase